VQHSVHGNHTHHYGSFGRPTRSKTNRAQRRWLSVRALNFVLPGQGDGATLATTCDRLMHLSPQPADERLRSPAAPTLPESPPPNLGGGGGGGTKDKAEIPFFFSRNDQRFGRAAAPDKKQLV